MEGKKGLTFALGAVVICLSLALTVMVIIVFTGMLGSKNNNTSGQTQTSVSSTEKPKEDDLSAYKLFEESEPHNLKYDDNKKPAVILINGELLYYNKIKDAPTRLERYDSRIKEIIATYFQKMTLEEAKMPETKEKAKVELTKQINEILSVSDSQKRDIVYTIDFDKWFYQ